MKKRITLFSLCLPRLSIAIALITLFCMNSEVHSQTSYNMSLIKNLNQHGGALDSYSALWGYTAPDGREYAILGCYTGTAFIDITDTLNIHEIGFVPTVNPSSGANIWREIKTYSHYAYIVSEVDSSGIQIVDLQYLPDSIRFVGRKLIGSHKTSHTISQEGHYLYLNGNNVEFGMGTTVLDLSPDPENPVVKGKWDVRYVHDSRIFRDTIYACNITDNSISIINATNKDNLTTIKIFPTTPVGSPHNCAVTSDGNYLYSTDETTSGKLKIWDIHEVQDPILIRVFSPPGLFIEDVIHNVEISGNYAVIAYYSAGVEVLDISNPENPVLVGFYDTYPEPAPQTEFGCWAVYRFPTGKIIASDRKYGLFVLKLKTQTERPVANFVADFTSISSGKKVKFFDLSSGFPNSRTWTITGPENFMSTDANPQITFTTYGTYTVKLRVANSLGTDSLTKVNFINVTGATFSQFNFLMPLTFTINTSPSDTSKYTFVWSKTGINPYFNYKLKLRKVGGSVDKIIPSGNNGRDTMISLRKSYLDSVGREFGLSYDSIRFIARAVAYNGIDSSQSSNLLQFTIRTNTVGINNITTEIPKEYRLFNNYPNPFNPVTKIKFDIVKQGFTSLTVFDIAGKEVTKLINQNLNPGSYEFDFDAADLPSGIYFYKLETENFKAVKKMSLIK